MTDLSEQFEKYLLSLDRLAARRLAAGAGDRMTPM
jgi:hypothetical protein